jgi:hypothetical protein
MTDFTHLDAINHRLSNERIRLAAAKNSKEIELRKVYVAGIEKELSAEYKFLGIEPQTLDEIMEDDLFNELFGE